jgi:uncharacterized protein (DUF433 family)
LIAARDVLDRDPIKFFACNATPEMPSQIILLAACSRWWVERCFENHRGEVGLDQYEGRLYLGLKRHLILSAVYNEPSGLNVKSAPGRHRCLVQYDFERGFNMTFSRITVNPDQMAGVPCIRGLRIPVATVVGMVADEMTTAEILAAYPDLEADDVREALVFAAETVRERELPLLTVP